MTIVLILFSLFSGELILTNGKKIPFTGDYAVEGNFVTFKDAKGELMQVPLKLVDLEKTNAHNATQPEPEVIAVRKEAPAKPGTLAKALQSNRTKPLVIDHETMRHYEPIETASPESLLNKSEFIAELQSSAYVQEVRDKLEKKITPEKLRSLYREVREKYQRVVDGIEKYKPFLNSPTSDEEAVDNQNILTIATSIEEVLEQLMTECEQKALEMGISL